MLERMSALAVNTTAWVYPPSYQKMCERMVEEHLRGPLPHEQHILRGLGEMMILSARGVIDIERQRIHDMLHDVRPHLDATLGYQDVIDPHKARLLENIAPLGDTE